MKSLKVACVSLCSTEDIASNLKNTELKIEEAASQGAEWIVLPEAFPYIGPDGSSFQKNKSTFVGTREFISSLAIKFNSVIFAGTIPQPSPKELKLLNRFEVFSRKGESIASYDKIHLFELHDELGNSKVSESKIYAPGSTSKIIEVDGFHVALAVCFDLRFPDFFLNLSEEIDVIVAPSAFTEETGRAHWELLLRARAIDNQCYVLGATQTGEHFPGRRSFGHPAIINPWGEILSSAKDSPQVIVAQLSQAELASSRQRLQLKHSRNQSKPNS